MTIEPDGRWAVPGAKKEATPKPEANVVDDDDVVVSSEGTKTANRNTTTPSLGSASTPALATPTSAASRDASAAPRSSSNKRPAPEVIDLTLSDDDDVPSRPVKRTNYGTNGYSGVPY